MMKTSILALLFPFTWVFLGSMARGQADLPINSVVRARITADGNVAGRRTDFLINLGVPFDNSPGWTLPEGHRFEVILPPEFANDLEFTNFKTGETGPVTTDTVFTSNSCTIGNFFCNTGVFVQGWPQRPIVNVLPPSNLGSPDDFEYTTEVYMLSNGDNENHFVFDAKQDVGPGSAPPGPGIKQIHMILPGFSNPDVSVNTDFPITVRETRLGEGGEVEVLRVGSAPFTIVPEIQPSINLTSIYDPTRTNTVFQQISPGEQPAQYEFFVWDGEGGAYEGVTISGTDVLNGQQDKIGRVNVTGPEGASGLSLASLAPSAALEGGDIFFHQPTARLSAQVSIDDLPGDYVTTIEIFAQDQLGQVDPAIVSSETLTVRVVPEPSSALLSLVAVGSLGFLRRRRIG